MNIESLTLIFSKVNAKIARHKTHRYNSLLSYVGWWPQLLQILSSPHISAPASVTPRSDISWSHHGDGACGEDGGHGARLQLQIYFTWGGNFRVSRFATCLSSWFMLSTSSLTTVTMPGSRRLVASSWRDSLHWTRHQQASCQTGLHLR